jgi:flagellar biosynthesis protein FlhG
MQTTLDQAHDLRRLALHRSRPETVRVVDRPKLLAVVGGKGGVGTTTIAIGLAGTLIQAGRRTVLIDADPSGGSIALRCGAEERHTLTDLLVGRRGWNEVIETAPGGIPVVAGARRSDDLGDRTPVAAELLLELLNDPSLEADAAVVDVGNALGRAEQRICRAADAMVMVTTSDAEAVVGTFEAIKRLACFGGGRNVPLHLVVNKVRTLRAATIVRYRLGRACRRLLGVNLVEMGFDPQIVPAKREKG